MSIITLVWMSYDLSDNSYLSLKQPSVIFVTKIVFLWQILFLIMNVYICAFHFLFVLFVIFLILPILVYECTLLNLMGVRAQLSNLFPLTTVSGIKLLLYLSNDIILYYHYCVISVNVSSNHLTIEKVIF